MTDLDSGSFFTVTETEQARLLTEPTSKEFFKPFLARERSASEAATVMQCSLNTMLYRIKTLLRAGLLGVVREEPRKGRAVKIYRSVHDAYFIPFSVTPYATLEERLEVQAAPIFSGLIHSYAAALKKNERYGHHIFTDENGTVLTSDLLPELTPTGQAVVYSDMTVQLRDEDARAVAQELRAVYERAGRLGLPRGDKAGQEYLHIVALLPFSSS